MQTARKAQFQEVIKLFRENYNIKEVATISNVSLAQVKIWRKSFLKSEKANIENRFKVDFACGRNSIESLAKKYNCDRRVLLKLKHKYFGKGSLKQKRIYQMHLAHIPTKAIADFFNIKYQHVYRAIKKEKASVLSVGNL